MSTPMDNRIPPPFVFLVIALAMGAASRLAPDAPIPAVVRYGLSGALFIVSGVIGFTAVRAFRRARTTINPVNLEAASSLVITGPFRMSRNPMYVSMAALLLALALILSRPWLLLGPCFFVLWTSLFQIAPEERVMQAKFGDAYAVYKARVRAWL